MRKNLFREEVIQSQKPGIYSQPIEGIFVPKLFSMYICFAAFAIIIIILFWGHYPKVERAKGIVNPSAGVVKVYAPKLGVVEQILIKEGQTVQKGEALLEIRQDRISSQNSDVYEKNLADINRLIEQAATRKDDLPNLKIAEKKQLDQEAASIRQQKLKMLERLALFNKRIEIRRQKMEKIKALLAKQSISNQEYNDAMEDFIGLKESKKEVESTILDLNTKLSNVNYAKGNIDKKYRDLSFSVEQTASNLSRDSSDLSLQRVQKIVAPITGTVASIQVYSGHSLDVTRPLLTIIPNGSEIQAHIFFSNRTLGKLKVGQEVSVAVDSFPVELYGSIQGEIISISSTVLSPKDTNDADIALVMEPSYRVIVRLRKNYFKVGQARYLLQAGATLTAKVVTEQRRVYEWLLEPLRRAFRS